MTMTPREYAAAEHGFTGKRGRLPANILAEYEAKFGTYVKPAQPKAAVTKSNDVRANKLDVPDRDWVMGELAEADDEKVISLLTNRKIAWKNETSGSIESATVRNPKVEVAASGRRIVTFNGADGEFKSVALASL